MAKYIFQQHFTSTGSNSVFCCLLMGLPFRRARLLKKEKLLMKLFVYTTHFVKYIYG